MAVAAVQPPAREFAPKATVARVRTLGGRGGSDAAQRAYTQPSRAREHAYSAILAHCGAARQITVVAGQPPAREFSLKATVARVRTLGGRGGSDAAQRAYALSSRVRERAYSAILARCGAAR